MKNTQRIEKLEKKITALEISIKNLTMLYTQQNERMTRLITKVAVKLELI